MDPLLVLFGLGVGVLVGTTGMGGGSLMTPLLILLPGVWIGSALAMRLPERGLRPALAIVLVSSGMALLSKAGVSIPASVLVAVPLGLAALAFTVLGRRRAPSGPPVQSRSRTPAPAQA